MDTFDVASLFTGALKEAFVNLPAHLRELDEIELYDAVEPTQTDWVLRRNFSTRVREARESHAKEVTASSIYEDVITRAYFYRYILAHPLKVAFMTRPLLDHTQLYEALHVEVMAKIHKTIKAFAPDPKYLPQLTKLAEISANRAHGAVIQRQQIVQKNINGGPEQKQLEGQGSIQDQIDALQRQLLTQAKDVTPAKDAE